MSDETPTLAEDLALVDPVILRSPFAEVQQAWQRIRDAIERNGPLCGHRYQALPLRPEEPTRPQVHYCDLPAGHADPWHRQTGGPQWRLNAAGEEE
jgi:hypothetical protein